MIIEYIDAKHDVSYFRVDEYFGFNLSPVDMANMLEGQKDVFGFASLAEGEFADLTIRALSGPATERRSGPVAPIEKEQYSEYQPELQVRKTISVLQLMR